MYLLHIRAVEAKDIPKMDVVGKADPYLLFQIKGIPDKWKTEDVKQCFEPVWNQEFHIPINQIKDTVLHVELYDWDKVSADDLISTRDFQLETLELGRVYDKWYEFFAAPKVEKPGQVHLVLQIANPDDYPFIQMTKELPKKDPIIEEIGLDQEPLGLNVQATKNPTKAVERGIPEIEHETDKNGQNEDDENETKPNENEVIPEIRNEVKSIESEVINNHDEKVASTKTEEVDQEPLLLQKSNQSQTDRKAVINEVEEREVDLHNEEIEIKKNLPTKLNANDSDHQDQVDAKCVMIILMIIIVEVFIIILKNK